MHVPLAALEQGECRLWAQSGRAEFSKAAPRFEQAEATRQFHSGGLQMVASYVSRVRASRRCVHRAPVQADHWLSNHAYRRAAP